MATTADNVGALCGVVQGIPGVLDFLTRHANYISNFDDNLAGLRSALEDLIAKRDDLVREVNAAEIMGQRQREVVKRWRLRVEAVITNTNLLVDEACVVQERFAAYGHCSTSIFSAYSSGKRIDEKLSEVRQIVSEELPQGLARQATLRAVVEEPVEETVGLETKLGNAWEILMRDNVRLLGIHGTGGVGKTTLLARINNKFKDEIGFVVVLVKVPEDADIGKIQDDIGNRLGLYDESWSKRKPKEKYSDIIRVLKYSKNRFVLLLDDLREVVSLSNIGITIQGKKCKIVFTTRSKDLCTSMGADEVIEVEPLMEEDALKMLTQKARRERLDGEMLEHAKSIVKKCQGLPLVLKLIGRHLSSKATAVQWNRVLDSLPEVMEKEVFPVLRISYDTLEDDDSKLCFKYCALFPEESNIRGDELVEYWIGEKFINEEYGRKRATDRGYTIIETLVEAGLLVLEGELKQKMYMQGLIREMALWIVVGGGEKFVSQTSAGLKRLPNINDWKIVTKMSLMNNEFKSIPDSSQFSSPDRLVTLFFQKNKLEDIVGIQVLSTLVVLDLSHNLGITELPEEISLLVSLRYLSLLETMIKNLQGLQYLTKLIHLNLELTASLQNIDLICSLKNLQVLRFYRSAHLHRELLENLEHLEVLKLLTITVEEDFEVLKAFLGSNLAGRTQGLYLDRLKVSGVSGKSFAATFGELGSLSKLGMTDCDIKESDTEWEENKRNKYSPSTSSSQITPSNSWFKNLSAVVLLSCVRLRDLTWLIYAENLESLSVQTSPKMKELISEEKAVGINLEPFRKLQILQLDYLKELKSIYWSPLSLPRLQKVHITNCPELRKLPLNSKSVENIDDLRIEVEEAWLQRVEWESLAEERFGPAIRPVSDS